MLFDRAQQAPDDIFLEEVSGTYVTYGEFLGQIGRFITALKSLGLSEGDRVATLIPQSIEAHAAWLAISWMRGWEVPINNEFHGDMLAYLLNDSKAKTIVLTDEFVPAVEAIAGKLDHLRTLLVLGPASKTEGFEVVAFDNSAAVDPAIHVRPGLGDGDIATVIYTSGTTGPSKGVILPWGELYSAIDIYGCRKDGTDALYAPFPTNHMSGKVPVFDMAAVGGRVVLRRRFSTSEFWSDVRQFQCTGTIMLGGVAVFLNNQPPSPEDHKHTMHTVLMAPVMENYPEFEARFGTKVMTSYGMSECGFPFLAPGGTLANSASCGRLRDSWHVRIVDPDGNDLPAGTVGELLVRCDRPYALMLGYLDRPEATAEAMREGWFHTGDGFKQDNDGNYYFVDRIKDAIRRRGENISSFEVEGFISRFPGIAECAAVAVPSETGEDEIMVHFVSTSGATVDLDALAQFCREQMPGFMVPRFFRQVAALPYTPTNKVQKRLLRASGTEGAWERSNGNGAGRPRMVSGQ